MRFLEAQEDFSERGFEVLPRDIDFLRDGLKFFLWRSLAEDYNSMLPPLQEPQLLPLPLFPNRAFRLSYLVVAPAEVDHIVNVWLSADEPNNRTWEVSR